MGLVSVLTSLLVLHYFSAALGEPGTYRQYRVLNSDRTYNSNPYVNNPYVYGSTIPENNNVYVIAADGRPKVVNDGATTVLRTGYTYGRSSGQSYDVSCSTCTCTSSTCGQGAQCQVIGGRPVCSCLKGYSGDPLSLCIRAECLETSDCRSHLVCQNGNCVNPCNNACGTNANCETRNHLPVCSCPAGYTGNPFTHCRIFDPEELCHPSPCGENTHCEVRNGIPTCLCLPGYHGSPLAGCRHECESDAECGPTLACIKFKCENPCTGSCGTNAECETIRNHQAVCKCPKNYFGNPYSSCQPECYGDSDCPSGRPACYYGICKSPCEGACGVNANCELRGLTPVCSCPKDMTGDPFRYCRHFEARDLCEPNNPCGIDAHCEPGHDRAGNERPVCTCPHGYTGDPLVRCIRGECTDNVECPDSQTCIDFRCQNPCIGQCGVNADCNPRRHLAVCTCPLGYTGDALIQCHQNSGAPFTGRCRTC